MGKRRGGGTYRYSDTILEEACPKSGMEVSSLWSSRLKHVKDTQYEVREQIYILKKEKKQIKMHKNVTEVSVSGQ